MPETVYRASFPPGHPYRGLPIGSMADLDAAPLDDVREWFRSCYGAAVSGAIGDIVRFGRPDDYVRTLRARLQSQTEAGVRQAAAQAFEHDSLTWVIVGDLAKIEAPIRKLGLGSVQVLDADGDVLR